MNNEMFQEKMREFAAKAKEQEKLAGELRVNAIESFSTTQLKAEIRRRKGERRER